MREVREYAHIETRNIRSKILPIAIVFSVTTRRLQATSALSTSFSPFERVTWKDRFQTQTAAIRHEEHSLLFLPKSNLKPIFFKKDHSHSFTTMKLPNNCTASRTVFTVGLVFLIAGMARTDHAEESHRLLTLIDESVDLEPLFPLHAKDYWGFFLAILGLVVAAGGMRISFAVMYYYLRSFRCFVLTNYCLLHFTGGIGGGGILVPIYILILDFPIKYAISLSAVTVLGGAVANNLVNYSKVHPDDDKRNHPKRPSVDWDLLLQLEPPAMAGTLIGAALNAILPSIVLLCFLLALLSFTAYKTLSKASQLYQKETKRLQGQTPTKQPDEAESMMNNKDTTYGALTLPQGEAAPEASLRSNHLTAEVWKAIFKMTALFVLITVLTLLEGGSKTERSVSFGLPQCDSRCHWYSQISMLAIIVAFGVWTRSSILHRLHTLGGPILSDIDWDESNTIHYPLYAILAGIAAGLFGIGTFDRRKNRNSRTCAHWIVLSLSLPPTGGGIVKGPLMLELGVHPTVASATTAAMILFTSATATISYSIYGFVQNDYALVCFAIGFISTMFGQSIMSLLMKRYNRPSYIAFSIGIVVALSAVCMTVESVSAIMSG